MKTLQIASDLHIEYLNKEVDPLDYIEPSAEVLVLAGDIGSLYRLDNLREFLRKICKWFQAVLYIPGNHEFYTISGYKPLSRKALEARLYSLENIPKLHILNGNSVRIGKTCIIGCTLWSNLKCSLPHFIVRIPWLNTYSYVKKHEEDVAFIKRMVKYCQKEKYKLVVITHHPPSYRAIEGIKKRKQFISLYASALDDLLDSKNTSLWICGHTHKNTDFVTRKGCRVVSNQKGRPRDRVKNYSKSFTVSV